MKGDDHSIEPEQLALIRKHAQATLRAASAHGRFPTPIDEVIAAASHTVTEHHEIDAGFLARMSKGVGGLVKRALSKVLGVLDIAGRIMHLDLSVPHRIPFLKLHELGHATLPWQRELYAITQDCEKTIDPEIGEMFERESNAFASEVLFQLDTFTREAADHRLELKTPLSLSKKYGASVYATVRRFVTTHSRSCAVVVLNPPVLCEGDGFRAPVRRVLVSPDFAKRFGEPSLPEVLTPGCPLGRLVPIGGRKASRPRAIEWTDRNGQRHDCIAEAFSYKYYTFILVQPTAAMTKRIVLQSA